MSHTSQPETSVPFSESQIQGFWSADKSMATAIVCLLSGVFTMGLFLYIGVCYFCKTEPMQPQNVLVKSR